MKFIADSMVGKLARYMRASGYDVKYSEKLDDDKIIEIASREKRIILTRDSSLVSRKKVKQENIKYLFIKSQKIYSQLTQLKNDLKIKIYPAFSRCIICNNKLVEISKESVKGKVPDYVYKNKSNFLFCKKCNKIYWKGSHYRQIKKLIEKINSLQ